MTEHISEDDLALYYYGEGRRRDVIERHIDECRDCRTLYADIAGTLALVAAADIPERGDQYGLETWQRIRPRLERGRSFSRFPGFSRLWDWSGFPGFGLAASAAAVMLMVAAFAGGRIWQRAENDQQLASTASPAGQNTVPSRGNTAGSSNAGNRDGQDLENHESASQRVLLTSVADHLDRSARMLTDIMNASGHTDISTEQRWASDLLDTSRLYRQDAADAGEQSVAGILDELERSLLEIVHSPSRISAADLEQMRRRIDAAALLFKVRVMSDELRQREQPQERSRARTTSTRTIS